MTSASTDIVSDRVFATEIELEIEEPSSSGMRQNSPSRL